MCSSPGERFRIFRAEKTYAVKAGRWYFEFETVTAGDMRVGWSRPGCQPDQELGCDEHAFAFDGFKVSGRRAAARGWEASSPPGLASPGCSTQPETTHWEDGSQGNAQCSPPANTGNPVSER